MGRSGNEVPVAKERKPYARYYIVRGYREMSAGDPAQDGAPFRRFVITSNEFTSTQGIFQVYCLECIGKGIKDGKLATSDEEPRVLFDEDFQGLDAAAKKFEELVAEAQTRGFKPITIMDVLNSEARAKGLH
jgi:hypothetical protein